MEGGFTEMPRGWPSGLGRSVRVTGGNPLGMIETGWRAQRRGVTLCSDATPSCFVAGNFPGYCYVSINILSDAFRELFHPMLRVEPG